ncbi:putative salicylate hydroxylase [Acephala macrosclerotiorum]|nr:putative salicylate hydroxylase [Acephala macrosclerotiorum]
MEHAGAALGFCAALNSDLYCGQGGHVLTYQIDKGATVNVVARGSMEGDWENGKWILKKDAKQMREDFKDRGGALVKDVDCWGFFDHPPSPTFFRGRVVLLGNAAHASTPHQGAGVGQGIEDALVLAELLQARATQNLAFEKVFEVYDVVRRPKAQIVVVTSSEAGEMYDFQGPARDEVEAIKRDLLSRLDWIWNEGIKA